MSSSRLSTAVRDRGNQADSRAVLVEALKIAAEIAADRDQPPSARTRALCELRGIAKSLDELDARSGQQVIAKWTDISVVAS